MLQTTVMLWFNIRFSLKLLGRQVQRNAVKVGGNLVRWRNEEDSWRRSWFSLALAEFQCCPSAAQPCQLTPWVSQWKECRPCRRQVDAQLWGWGLQPSMFGEARFYRDREQILRILTYCLKNMGSLFCAQLWNKTGRFCSLEHLENNVCEPLHFKA